MTNNRTEPEQWAVDVEYLAKLADWAAGQGLCQIDGLPDPDEWCYDKWNVMFPKSCGDDYSAQALADGLIASIQRAFEDRERKLREQRTCCKKCGFVPDLAG